MSESKSPLISYEQAAQIARGDSTFVNVEEAKDFITRVSDPVTQEVFWTTVEEYRRQAKSQTRRDMGAALIPVA